MFFYKKVKQTFWVNFRFDRANLEELHGLIIYAMIKYGLFAE